VVLKLTYQNVWNLDYFFITGVIIDKDKELSLEFEIGVLSFSPYVYNITISGAKEGAGESPFVCTVTGRLVEGDRLESPARQVSWKKALLSMMNVSSVNGALLITCATGFVQPFRAV
jgi:hypothetical protein